MVLSFIKIQYKVKQINYCRIRNMVSKMQFLVLVALNFVLVAVDSSNPSTTFLLYTVDNPYDPEAYDTDANGIESSMFYDPSKWNVILIHGWETNYTGNFSVAIKDAYIETSDYNIFVLDWSKIAMEDYLTAFSSVKKIGQLVANFISALEKTFGLDGSNFILVGHSLGAHIAGCAGAALKGSLSVIVGLDPAGPLFKANKTDNRLDPTDAKFVEVLHTNGGIFGYSSDCGTVDLRANGGTFQKGCGSLDLTESCSHQRAFWYFAESIRYGGFTSKRCSDYSTFLSGKCNAETTYLGRTRIDTRSKGKYFFQTNSEPPYSLS